MNRQGKKIIYTPPVDDCIYNQGTRQAIVELGSELEKELGCPVVEKEISIHELISAQEEGRLIEMFATSTQRQITPIDMLKFEMHELESVNTEVSLYIDKKLTEIRQGDPNNKWISKMED